MIAMSDLFGEPGSMLFVGAHPDDIEIGCGATLLRIAAELPSIVIHSVVMSANGARAAEARAGAEAFIGDAGRLTLHDFADGYLPWSGAEVKKALAGAVDAAEPDVVFVHRIDDAHQDHRLLGELAIQVARSSTIFEYEIPKYDGDLGRPNLYLAVPPTIAETKLASLREAFPSQSVKDWFDDETLAGLMRIRGVECRNRFAEAFWVRKLVVA